MTATILCFEFWYRWAGIYPYVLSIKYLVITEVLLKHYYTCYLSKRITISWYVRSTLKHTTITMA